MTTTAYGLNDAGQVVGQTSSHAFVWQDGVVTDFGALGGGAYIALGINNSGQIVGSSVTAAGSRRRPVGDPLLDCE